MKFSTQSEHLLQIVHAKFQVNVTIFLAARLEKGIFAELYSILLNSKQIFNLDFFLHVHTKFPVNAAIFAAAWLEKGIFAAF